jgi:hypothetical protein
MPGQQVPEKIVAPTGFHRNTLKRLLARQAGWLAWLALALFVLLLASKALAVGGRWDLYEAIAMADRWSGAFGYSKGLADQFMPSTPYFPGVTLLAVAFGGLGAYQAVCLQAVAIGTVVALHVLLFRMYRRLGGSWPLRYYLAFSVVVSVVSLAPWLTYAVEFKPDTAALCFFVLAFLILTGPLGGVARSAALIASVALAILFKQQIVAPFAALVLAHMLSCRPWAAKVGDVLSMAGGALLVALIIYRIDGGLFYAVFGHIGRSRNSIIDAPHLVLAATLVFIVMAGYLVSGKHQFGERIARARANLPYSLPMLAWLLAGLAGAMNLGGNVGNSAVGVVLALPLLALLFERIKQWLMSLALIVVVLFCAASIWRADSWSSYQARRAIQAEIAQKIEMAGAKHVLVSGDTYMALRHARLDKISEIDTWAHLSLGINKNKSIPNANALLDALKPDAVVCIQGCAVFSSAGAFTPNSKGYREIPLTTSRTAGVMYIRQDFKLP